MGGDKEQRGAPRTGRRPAGGPAKGDRRRGAILDAVEELLAERPISALAVDHIAARAGISRSGFYFYFESKYAALSAALGDVWEEMMLAADAFFAGVDAPPSTWAGEAVDSVTALWGRHATLLGGMVEAAASDPGARAVWDAWIDRFVVAIAERIAAERAAGRAPAGPPDAADLARALMLLNERVLYDAHRRDAPPDQPARAAQALTGIWLASVWAQRTP